MDQILEEINACLIVSVSWNRLLWVSVSAVSNSFPLYFQLGCAFDSNLLGKLFFFSGCAIFEQHLSERVGRYEQHVCVSDRNCLGKLFPFF